MNKFLLFLCLVFVVSGCSSVFVEEQSEVVEIVEISDIEVEAVGETVEELEIKSLEETVLDNSSNEIEDLPVIVEGLELEVNPLNIYEDVAMIKFNLGENDSLILKLNSKVIFDSKSNSQYGEFDFLLSDVSLTLRGNVFEVEYVDVIDEVGISFSVFPNSQSNESIFGWRGFNNSGSFEFPLDLK